MTDTKGCGGVVMVRPTVSVALACCNGGAFLAQQLDSLAVQRHLPTELVVCDDASTDDSWELLVRFASRVRFPVVMHRNAARIGFAANFRQAAEMCTSEWIAFCDQDDVWHPEKLETLLAAIGRGDHLQVLHNHVLIDGDGTPIGDPWGTTPREREVTLTRLGYPLEWSGGGNCTMVRADVARRCLRLLPAGHSHDTWINGAVMMADRRLVIEDCLISYRRHPWQVTADLDAVAAPSRSQRPPGNKVASLFRRLVGAWRNHADAIVERQVVAARRVELASWYAGPVPTPAARGQMEGAARDADVLARRVALVGMTRRARFGGVVRLWAGSKGVTVADAFVDMLVPQTMVAQTFRRRPR